MPKKVQAHNNNPPSDIPLLRKKPWSDQEDLLVRTLVQKYGPQRWSFLAKFVPGRLGKQCRERWHNHLNPSILKVDWMYHEQWILFLAHTVHGSKWAEMTKMIPGRTDNSIKNHWNSTMKKKLHELSKTLQKIIKNQEKGVLYKNITIPQNYIETQKLLLLAIFNDKENIVKFQQGQHSEEKEKKTVKRKVLQEINVAQNTETFPHLSKSTEKYLSIKKDGIILALQRNLRRWELFVKILDPQFSKLLPKAVTNNIILQIVFSCQNQKSVQLP